MKSIFSKAGVVIASLVLPLASYALSPPSQADHDFQRRCILLRRTFRPDHTKVLVAEFLPKGTNWTNAPFVPPSCGFYGSGAIFQVDACRLRVNITTSSTSNVIAEIILPATWEKDGKRVITTGNGGLNGCIALNDLTYASALGFVAIGTNNGHDGFSGEAFLNRPEVIKDFAYRSLLVGTDIGKQAAKQLYEKSPGKTYYMGCSTGGRQGLKLAQDFPELFDGILAAAPANDFLDLIINGGQIYALVGNPGAAGYLTTEQWVKVHQLVLSECDRIDGVADGILEDPRKCRPRFETLLCDREAGQTWESHKCLTSVQIEALNQVFGPLYGVKGEFLYPRMNPGAEIEFDLGIRLFGGPNIIIDWVRYVVLNDTRWDFNSSWSLEFAETVRALDPFGISTWNPDLSHLRNAKHKLITYHGLADGFITSENSYLYYDYVSRSMGLPSRKLDDFYRFFTISGMGHCGGGDGAWYIGGAGQPGTAFPSGLPPSEHCGVLMDLVKWVEKGIAPERVRGTSIGREGEQIVRDHCKYPLKSTYVGSGNPNRPESWKCV
ncbi:Tannase [Drechslerella dactyloides]|uniref:Carboxylic ester hydrolase n=1 Tax=Drechslerella dactyloides TaxID=74499 RepID=A0AAD6NJI5_DREDA|nr:Tannase [Drechslerella dactyloides]